MREQKEKTGPLLADLSDQEAAALCRELREELIRDVSRTGDVYKRQPVFSLGS